MSAFSASGHSSGFAYRPPSPDRRSGSSRASDPIYDPEQEINDLASRRRENGPLSPDPNGTATPYNQPVRRERVRRREFRARHIQMMSLGLMNLFIKF